MPQIIVDNIRNITKEKGFTQNYVATRSGFTPQTYSHMLNGRKIIKAGDLAVIADVLGVTPNDLYGIKTKQAS